jgi:hypothetical protein
MGPYPGRHGRSSAAHDALSHSFTSPLPTAGPRNAVLLECGHGGICMDCAKRLLLTGGRTCPICRQLISQVMLPRSDACPMCGRPFSFSPTPLFLSHWDGFARTRPTRATTTLLPVSCSPQGANPALAVFVSLLFAAICTLSPLPPLRPPMASLVLSATAQMVQLRVDTSSPQTVVQDSEAALPRNVLVQCAELPVAWLNDPEMRAGRRATPNR